MIYKMLIPLFIVIAIGMFWWYSTDRVKWVQNGPSIVSSTPSSEEIVNWQIYKNTKYGYEIMFPQDFEIMITSERVQVISHKTKKSNLIEMAVLPDDIAGQARTWKDFDSFITYIDKFIDELGTAAIEDERHLYSKRLIKFNGYDAVLVKFQLYQETNRILLYYNHYGFQISYSAFSHEYEEVISKILSTFKFGH
jgi:hypothetical protein